MKHNLYFLRFWCPHFLRKRYLFHQVLIYLKIVKNYQNLWRKLRNLIQLSWMLYFFFFFFDFCLELNLWILASSKSLYYNLFVINIFSYTITAVFHSFFPYRYLATFSCTFSLHHKSNKI